MSDSQTDTTDKDSATRRRNRNRILDATKDLLTAGERFTKVSIHRIAQAAGVSRATFYLHFESKSDLIAGLANRELGGWIDSTRAVLNSAAMTPQGLREVARALVELYRQNRGALAGVIEMAEYDDETRAAWQETVHEIAELFQDVIQRRCPTLSAEQAAYRSRMIAWGGERFLHQEAPDSPSDRDDAIADVLADLAWKLMNE